jgi:hypothetical protein
MNELIEKIDSQLIYKIELVNNYGGLIDCWKFKTAYQVKQWLKNHSQYEIIYHEDDHNWTIN